MSGLLAQAFKEACQSNGNKPALFANSHVLSYSDLLKHALLLAGELTQKGVQKSEPILAYVSNELLDIGNILGIWLAGGVVVPVNRVTPLEAFQKLQKKVGSRFVVDLISDSSTDKKYQINQLAADLPIERSLLSDAAFIIFTSGSTGEPKGVVIGQEAFNLKIKEIDRLLNFNASDRVLLVLNINFIFGLWVALLALLKGGQLYIQQKFDSNQFITELIESKITRVGMVPTMMRTLFSDAKATQRIADVVSLSSLRQILIGGESLGTTLAATVRERFKNTDLIDIYGSTETASCDFFSFPSDYEKYPGAIGRPSGGVRFRIVDEQQSEAKFGAVGELQIASPFVTKGYLDEIELTNKAFSGEWFKTGDIARELDHGVVEILGRSKEIISRGGNKVTPVELEQVISSHPDVVAAMVVGVPDDILGERIHALIVPRSDATIVMTDLQEFLKKHLERFKMPDVYYIEKQLPQGRTGKADRGQFKNSIISKTLSPHSYK